MPMQSGNEFLLDLFAQSLCLPSIIPIRLGLAGPSVAGKKICGAITALPHVLGDTAEGRQTITYFKAGERAVFSGAMKPW